MECATRSDFDGYVEEKIIQQSTWYYALRIGGFFVGGVLPLIGLIWGLSFGTMKQAVLFMICMVPLGFVGFAVSFKALAYCKVCGGTLKQYWLVEKRQDGQYSGPVAVCKDCNKFESRISYDFEG